MQSFGKRQRGLFALVLAAGASGALMGMGSAGPAPQAAGSTTTGISSLLAQDFFSGAFAQLQETGDGTGLAYVFTYLSPTVFMGLAFYETPDYTISADVRPGQSGQGSGSGTGHFELEDVFAFDLMTGMPVGPYDVSVDLAVAEPTTVAALVSQGVTAQFNPLTGETSIVREHRVGNQAYGDTAGSLSIFVDDGSGAPGLVADYTGIFGLAEVDMIHDVEQIH